MYKNGEDSVDEIKYIRASYNMINELLLTISEKKTIKN